MPFATGPVLQYQYAGRYATVGPTVYAGADDVITIPAGFVTDLASVPRIFWALMPPHGAYEKAAVLHDWFCERLAAGDSPVSSRDADGLFRRVAREHNTGLVTRWLLWTGVRWGALANPARRAGWWRDAPPVLGITAAAAAALAAGTVAVDRTVHHLTRSARGRTS